MLFPFSKLHPSHAEIFDSFNPNDENQELLNYGHPHYYFDPSKPMVSIYDQSVEKNTSNGGKYDTITPGRATSRGKYFYLSGNFGGGIVLGFSGFLEKF